MVEPCIQQWPRHISDTCDLLPLSPYIHGYRVVEIDIQTVVQTTKQKAVVAFRDWVFVGKSAWV